TARHGSSASHNVFTAHLSDESLCLSVNLKPPTVLARLPAPLGGTAANRLLSQDLGGYYCVQNRRQELTKRDEDPPVDVPELPPPPRHAAQDDDPWRRTMFVNSSPARDLHRERTRAAARSGVHDRRSIGTPVRPRHSGRICR